MAILDLHSSIRDGYPEPHGAAIKDDRTKAYLIKP